MSGAANAPALTVLNNFNVLKLKLPSINAPALASLILKELIYTYYIYSVAVSIYILYSIYIYVCVCV